MASVAIMVGGAVANALAFSGSNYLFSKFGQGDTAEEQKRHDKAMEQLQAAQAAWSKRRTEESDGENHAVQTFHKGTEAMLMYNRLTGETLDPLGLEPQLSDFYTPSSAQKDREIVFIVLGMAITGLVA